MADSAKRPNTLTLAEVRHADTKDEFRPAMLFLGHLVAVMASSGPTTRLVMSNGQHLEVNMTFEKFNTRLSIDNPEA